MTIQRSSASWLAGVVLGLAACGAWAQSPPPGASPPPSGPVDPARHWRDNPQWQACRKQADDKQLPRGPERKSFMMECFKAAGGQVGPDHPAA
jgi:hypothetical protein